MKVLHILEATGGGTRRHVLDLLAAQPRSGIECELLASPRRAAHWQQDADFLRARDVRVLAVEMQRGFAPPSDAAALRQIAAHWRKSRPDIVHCHSTKAGFLARLARPFCNFTPLIYTPHCIAFDTLLPPSQRRLALWMETSLAPLASHFIAVSQHEKRAMMRARIAASTRIEVIHNGLDAAAFDALPRAAREDFGLHETDFVIGCFGRLTRQKNQLSLIRALPRVLARQPNARLLLVGGGEDEAMLRGATARLQVTSRVAFLGEVFEPRPLLSLCDVVAQPSRWEGCPYSILEAMAARRAILATCVGGVAELLDCENIDDCGELVSGSQPEVLARTISGTFQRRRAARKTRRCSAPPTRNRFFAERDARRDTTTLPASTRALTTRQEKPATFVAGYFRGNVLLGNNTAEVWGIAPARFL